MICLALVSYQQKQLMYKMYGENSLKLDTSWVEFPDAAILTGSILRVFRLVLSRIRSRDSLKMTGG
jgi:hypothetical protein